MNFGEKLLLFSLIYNIGPSTVSGTDWWKYTTVYEVYIWSFMDSNGDGIGDIKGVTSKLDHFVDLGIETIWITPFFKSPMVDTGYDITNFTDVDPIFGNMEDFDELIQEMDKRGLKLILDFVLNHSSDEHVWFKKSIEKIEPYTDYYVWKDAKGYDERGHPIPPNNWITVINVGSAWEWNENRKQFYLHQFVKNQPDFNLRNPAVKAELKNILKFWFDKGVAGGRLDATIHYIEDSQFRDEPLKVPNTINPKWEDYVHIYMVDLWETYEFLHELREYMDKSWSIQNNEKIFFAEAYSNMNNTMAYYGTKDYKVTHFPFNFYFINLKNFPSAKSLDIAIKDWFLNMPAHGVANWLTENHDHFRIGHRFIPEFMDILVMTILTLPGIACIYYGQEIGLVDYPLSLDSDSHDTLLTNDPGRLPMPWDDSLNGGFTSNSKPWLPLNPDYWRVNVESQKSDPRSRYNMYKTLSRLRKTKTLKYGNFKSYLISTWVYAFSRSLAGEPTYITILNLGKETEMIHLHHSIPKLPAFVRVLATSLNAGYAPGDKVYTHPKYPQTFILRPMSAIVVCTKK